jgi:NAD(P)H-dependent FMN reductase
MKKIIAFAGSTSSTSINKKLVSYATSLLNDTEFEILDMNEYSMPLFSVDAEKNGYPELAHQLKEKLASADGFIISLAEHNGSYASAYKNSIDWVSRINRKLFNEKPMLLMATSPGRGGGRFVLASAKSYYPNLGAKVVADFSLPKFEENFVEGKVFDKELNLQLAQGVQILENHI